MSDTPKPGSSGDAANHNAEIAIKTDPPAQAMVPSKPATELVVKIKADEVAPPAAASVNPAVETGDESSPVPTSGFRSKLDDISSRLAERYEVGGHSDLGVSLAESDRTDVSLVRAEVNREDVTRYPNMGTFGICPHSFRYNHGPNQAQPQEVTPAVAYDQDNRWRVTETTEVQGIQVALSGQISRAIQERETDVSSVLSLARYKGVLFEGSVAVPLATKLVAHGTAGAGYSPLLPVAKLEGYQLSLQTPPDDGFLKVASIPIDSPPSSIGEYFPTTAGHNVNLVAVGAIFTGLQGLNGFLDGSYPVPGFPPASVGSTTAVIPVPHSAIGQKGALPWLAVSQLQYPVRDIVKQGIVSDLNGQLMDATPAVPVPWETHWCPASTLVAMPGVTPVNNNDTLMIFVLVEDYQVQAVPSLNLPQAAGDVVVQFSRDLTAAAVDISPAVVQCFDDANLQGAAADHIRQAGDIVAKYWAGYAAARDATALWASHTCLSQLAGEKSLMGPAGSGGCYAPTGASLRAWVPPLVVTETVPAAGGSALARPWGCPTNAAGMYPATDVNPANAVMANNPAKFNYYVPFFDPLKAVGVASGLLVPAVQPGDVAVAISPGQAAITNIRHSRAIAYGVDTIFVSNEIPRCIMWASQLPGGQAPRTSANLKAAQDDWWGRRGRKSEADTHSFSSLTTRWLFGGTVKLAYPSNGCILPPAAGPPAWAANTGPVLARFDLPTLRTTFSDNVKLSESTTIGLSDFRPEGRVRRVGVARSDLLYDVPDATKDCDRAMSLARELDGMVSNGQFGQGIYDHLRLVSEDERMAGQRHLPTPIFSPLTWGGLVGIPGWPGLINFQPSQWCLSHGRPIVSFSPYTNISQKLVVRDPGLAYDKARVPFKPAYYVDAVSDKYAFFPLTTESRRYGAARY